MCVHIQDVSNDMVDYIANRWFYWKIFWTKIA